jgi:DNA-binding beta-propeller fold protein YncE
MGNAHSILYRDDLNTIYIADGGLGLVKVYSGSEYQLVESIKLLLDADSIAYDPATKYLYVTNGGEGAKLDYAQVSIIDTTRSEHIGDIRIPADTVEAMTLDQSSSRLYINVTSKNSIGVIDRKQRALVAMWPITMGKKNMASALDPTNHRLFVGCRNTETSGVIVVFDTDTGKELQTLPISGWVDYMAFDEQKRRLYASCGSGAGSAYAFQQDGPDKYHLLRVVPTAPMAKTALFVPELQELLVSVPHKDETEISRVMVFSIL